ncbi:MAG: hypothetical protein ASARMPREDX12_001977 [Alectoria sarmentosa]|nr:MAG: hypothetical protein ASARMPREDX12_001977 [Alectoria sarmentosa]
MDPVTAISLAATVASTFREVYVVARFIYRTIDHVKKSESEQEDLQVEFMSEILYLDSFGRLYLTSGGIMGDAELDKRWLKQIQAILQRLQEKSAAFAKIAKYEDPEYQNESPYENSQIATSRFMDFKAFDDKPLSPTKKGKSIYNLKSWRWALLDRQKYEDILASYQKWMGKLKDLLPLSIAFSLKNKHQRPSALEALARNENAKNLGLESHANLWQLMLDPAFRQTNLKLEPSSLEAPSQLPEGSVLGLARLHAKDTQSKTKILVEYKAKDPNALIRKESAGDPIDQLASLLSLSGKHDLRTLSFKGYVDQPEKRRYAFIFTFPDHVHRSAPTSLHAIISMSSVTAQLSLPDRFHMAQTITKTLAAFHSAKWVHKSIRSQSIIIFSKLEDEKETMVKSPYLANFEYSRHEKGETVRAPIDDLEISLYCHPDRNPPKQDFSRIHDIYALGIVLLEIGLWCTALNIYNQYRARMTDTAKVQQLTSTQTKKLFIDAAQNRLSHHMGPAYTKAVLACLRDDLVEDIDEADFPMIFQDKVVDKLDIRAAESASGPQESTRDSNPMERQVPKRSSFWPF